MATVADSTPHGNLRARYATFHHEPGYAMRTADRRVFFVTHAAEMVPLTNADLPDLVVLGDVNVAERQHLLDTLAGGYAALACSRKMEVL